MTSAFRLQLNREDSCVTLPAEMQVRGPLGKLMGKQGAKSAVEHAITALSGSKMDPARWMAKETQSTGGADGHADGQGELLN